MKQHYMAWSFPLFCLFILLVLATSTVSQQVGNEEDFGYIPGSPNGPEHWGDLKEEWATCKTGQLQSPIELSQSKVEEIQQEIFKSYKPSDAILKNRGHDIMLKWQVGSSSIRINDTDYILQQCHWHSPSEHTINGERFALELHMVHQSAENKTAVIGLVYRVGKPNPFLSKLAELIKTIAGSRREVNAGVIDPNEIKMGGNKYYRYIGSFTTPPCTEGVLWTVNKQAATVSIQQLALLRRAVDHDAKENARPLQPLNGRDVHLYAQKNQYGSTILKIPLFRRPFGEYLSRYFP